MPTERRLAFIKGLRDFAAFLEDNSSVEPPVWNTLTTFVDTKEELATQARAVRSWQKDYNGDWMNLRQVFSEDLQFDVSIRRGEVCRKVQTGVKVLPATPEQVIPAQPEREVPVEEWICDEPILAEA
jgi:hypothetical protein